jgi:acylphosphatase
LIGRDDKLGQLPFRHTTASRLRAIAKDKRLTGSYRNDYNKTVEVVVEGTGGREASEKAQAIGGKDFFGIMTRNLSPDEVEFLTREGLVGTILDDDVLDKKLDAFNKSAS